MFSADAASCWPRLEAVMTPEQKMAVLFAADVPPARDLAFTVEVARRVAWRRAWRRVVAMAPWAVVAAAMLWAIQPVLAPLGSDLGEALVPAMSVIGATAGVAILALWAARALRPA